MSVQVEKLEKNMAKLTIEVSSEEFENAIAKAYKKNKNKISMPGFRKGKAPRAMIEKMYGKGIFYEDAANSIIPDAYADAAKESELEIVAQPEIDVTQIESGKPFIFTATVALKPEVTLGEYKGIEVEKKEVEVTDEEVEAEINKVRESNARMLDIDDRATQDGDTVLIDFDGYVDGKQFEGGKADDYSLVLGSHSFIDNFEEQLVGKNIGDDVEVNVTFPENYQAEELQGKPAVFKVKIKEIKVKELPELDDDFAQDVSNFDTIAEYKEDLKKKLTENKEEALKREREEAVIGKIIENAQMDIPEQMVDAQTRQMTQEFAQRLSSQGLSIDQYMQFTGLTPQKMIEELKPQALKRIQSRLVLEAVVAAENIETTEEELDKEIENMASMYQMEVDKLKEVIGEEEKKQIGLDLAVQKERSPEQYQNAIHNALQDSQRVIKLIDGLLNLAKADYEPEQIKREEIRLDELLLDARELVLRAHPDFHVELVFEQEAEDDKVLTVIGNSYLLTTAFVNLIENNCKYSRNQTSFIQISFWEEWSIIRLSDDGVGMSDKDKEHLFQLFYRGENKDVASGYGIGMTLAQKILSLHKGEISVFSHPGEGTTYVVKLPHI